MFAEGKVKRGEDIMPRFQTFSHALRIIDLNALSLKGRCTAHKRLVPIEVAIALLKDLQLH